MSNIHHFMAYITLFSHKISTNFFFLLKHERKKYEKFILKIDINWLNHHLLANEGGKKFTIFIIVNDDISFSLFSVFQLPYRQNFFIPSQIKSLVWLISVMSVRKRERNHFRKIEKYIDNDIGSADFFARGPIKRTSQTIKLKLSLIEVLFFRSLFLALLLLHSTW